MGVILENNCMFWGNNKKIYKIGKYRKSNKARVFLWKTIVCFGESKCLSIGTVGSRISLKSKSRFSSIEESVIANVIWCI